MSREEDRYLDEKGYELEAAESGVFWYFKVPYRNKDFVITFVIESVNNSWCNGVIYKTDTKFYDSIEKEDGFMIFIIEKSEILFSTYGCDDVEEADTAMEEWRKENVNEK